MKWNMFDQVIPKLMNFLSKLRLQSGQTTSFLWRIAAEPPSYFFGTIHVPYSRVWDYVPENVKRAFDASDAVFFELDLTDPNTISALTSCQLLPVQLHFLFLIWWFNLFAFSWLCRLARVWPMFYLLSCTRVWNAIWITSRLSCRRGWVQINADGVSTLIIFSVPSPATGKGNGPFGSCWWSTRWQRATSNLAAFPSSICIWPKKPKDETNGWEPSNVSKSNASLSTDWISLR